MASPNAKSLWLRARRLGTAARTNATRKPAGKRKLQLTLDTRPFASLEAEALVTYIFDEPDPIQGRLAEIDSSANGLLKRIAGSGEATGKTLEFTLIHAPGGLKASRLLL